MQSNARSQRANMKVKKEIKILNYVFWASLILLFLIGIAWISSSLFFSYQHYTTPLEKQKIDIECALEFDSIQDKQCDSALCLKELKDKCSE